jgi:ubiquinone/menaquinone biosynthesis C-methylase UbiE
MPPGVEIPDIMQIIAAIALPFRLDHNISMDLPLGRLPFLLYNHGMAQKRSYPTRKRNYPKGKPRRSTFNSRTSNRGASRRTGPSRTGGRTNRKPETTGWEYVSKWYDGMVGESGSQHHQFLIPKLIDRLSPKKGDHVLDIGCGQGVLAPHIAKKNTAYTGVDISPTLIKQAKKHHGTKGRFIVGNAHDLRSIPELTAGTFDSAVFLLSVQDMRYPEKAIASAGWALKDGGKIVLCMLHPAFRIPRQSGWGFDEKRKLIYRRIDSYLSRLDVPLRKDYHTKETLTRSYHRPIGFYIRSLSSQGIHITGFEELPSPKSDDEALSKAERRALSEFPLFLIITAEKS